MGCGRRHRSEQHTSEGRRLRNPALGAEGPGHQVLTWTPCMVRIQLQHLSRVQCDTTQLRDRRSEQHGSSAVPDSRASLLPGRSVFREGEGAAPAPGDVVGEPGGSAGLPKERAAAAKPCSPQARAPPRSWPHPTQRCIGPASPRAIKVSRGAPSPQVRVQTAKGAAGSSVKVPSWSTQATHCRPARPFLLISRPGALLPDSAIGKVRLGGMRARAVEPGRLRCSSTRLS